MKADDQFNEQDRLLLEKVESILTGEGDDHLEEDVLYGFCAKLAHTLPRVSPDFKERLWGRLLTNEPKLSPRLEEGATRTHLVSFPHKEYRSLSAERMDHLLHTAWGWILPAGAMILIILLLSLLLQLHPRQGGPAVAITATHFLPGKPTAVPQTSQDPIGARYYIVQEGNTLASIADQFDVTVEELLEANRIESLGIPYVGMKLTIPSSTLYPAPNDSSYTVREGDTLIGIAQHFGVSVEALLEANNLDAGGAPYAGMTLFIPVIYPGPRDSMYVVQEGDTLTSIADKYGLTIGALLDANRLKIGGIPYGGRTLVIPTKGIYPAPKDSLYTIREGDTLAGVAGRFGLTVEELLAANQLTNKDAVQVGQTLFIPLPSTAWLPAPPGPEDQAILDELHGLVASRRAGILTGPGWIYLHLQDSETYFCDTGEIEDNSRPCEYEEHYWFELNASNKVVATIYRKLDRSGQALEEWVKRDGLYQNFTRGIAYTVPLTSTYQTDWGFTAQAEVTIGGFNQAATTADGGYPGMFIVDMSLIYGGREAVFDPQTGALLELSSSGGRPNHVKVLTEDRVDAPPADALALFDRPLTAYQPRPPQGDPLPADFDLANSKLQIKTVGGDDYDSPSFWYADIYAASGYLVGRVDFGALPGGYCQRSPDGLKLAFDHVTQNANSSAQQLRWLDLTSPDDVHTVHPELNLSSPPAWDPGSTRLAFTACDASQDCGLYTYDTVSGDLHSLTNSDSTVTVAPAWSPDGTQIAYWTGEGYSQMSVVVDANSGTVLPAPDWQPDFTVFFGFQQCENLTAGMPYHPEPTQAPYPPPFSDTANPIPDFSPTPTAYVPFPDDPQVILMGKAVTLRAGYIWLLAPGRSAEPLAGFGDVSVIFGWNKDGSLLLFGRGRSEQPEFSSDTTDLWILDANTDQATQFTASGLVNSAAWSPVADEIAYTENGDVLTVADRTGAKLHQLEHVILGFNWSPDGSVLAVQTYTPDMVDSDGLKYTVLAIWRLADENLQLLNDAKTEVQSFPIWSMDGQEILFRRDFYAADQQDRSGLYIVDVASGQMKPIDDTLGAMDPVRSPRADLVAYHIGDKIYVTDFEGQSRIVAQGKSFIWLVDGRTLLYRANDDSYQTATLDIQVAESASGGQRYSIDLYTQPEFFLWIRPNGQVLVLTDPDQIAIEKTLRTYLEIDAEASYTCDDSRLVEVLANDPRGGLSGDDYLDERYLKSVQWFKGNPNLTVDQIGYLDVRQAYYAFRRYAKQMYDEAVAQGRLTVPTLEEVLASYDPHEAQDPPKVEDFDLIYIESLLLETLPEFKALLATAGYDGVILPRPLPDTVVPESFVIDSITVNEDLAHVIGNFSYARVDLTFARIDGKWYLIGNYILEQHGG